ncbi:MAG: glutamate--tRNA ligase [Methanobacterium sp.]|uniref:glutamate--tRNA ligase n=1 Tax=Methanobacterium sp. TaxID=2164 RepID=UPI003D657ED7|nr:glutamate--tRNA ligase [Methanobacterium sp.]
MNNLKDIVYKYALQNAVKHKKNAQNGAVIGSIMSSHPEYRREAKEVSKTVGEVLNKINAMTLDEQVRELEKLGGMIEEKKKVSKKGLADLPNVKGKVVLRFAPNPSGPLHIGHARAAVLNNEYVKRYDGKLVLRIEDTDPRRVDPDAYKMIDEDLAWMDVKIDEKVIQSDRLPIYYEYAEKLIEIGGAYMCTCEGGAFKKLKDESKSCPCRDLNIDENLKRWKEMENLSEGEAVLRVKTDINHKNPAIRDFVAMRVVDAEHPRIGFKYKIYPMMNFSVAVDDHLLGITHVLRGKDHLANSEKQEYLYNHFGWEIPVFIHYGRLKMEDIALSTSKARAGIVEGKYSGWDDPRLGTIRAIAKRGIMREAIYKLMNEIGTKIADTTVSWKKIYGLNRTILEETANRYFFIWNPEEVKIKDLPESAKGIIERPLHPDFLERGNRELQFNGEIYLVKEDIRENKMLRLMDAANIIFKDEKAVFESSGFEEAREAGAQIIHWIPKEGNIKTEIVMPDASIIKGLAEPSCCKLKVDDIVQFERFGFARLDEINENKLRFYFAHK